MQYLLLEFLAKILVTITFESILCTLLLKNCKYFYRSKVFFLSFLALLDQIYSRSDLKTVVAGFLWLCWLSYSQLWSCLNSKDWNKKLIYYTALIL